MPLAGQCKATSRSIADHAEPEVLYDEPAPDTNKLRITGPFTVEAVPNPTVVALNEAQPARDADTSVARSPRPPVRRAGATN